MPARSSNTSMLHNIFAVSDVATDVTTMILLVPMVGCYLHIRLECIGLHATDLAATSNASTKKSGRLRSLRPRRLVNHSYHGWKTWNDTSKLCWCFGGKKSSIFMGGIR